MNASWNKSRLLPYAASIWLVALTGCTVPAIQASRVPREFLGLPRTEMQEITMTRLRQTPPRVYQLGPGDVLGIYIETVIGKSEEPPPVYFPNDRLGSGTDEPALGFPVPIREDGTVALPLVDPIKLTGLTLTQATGAIRRAYTVDRKILPEGKDRIIVTLQRKRKIKVLVVREESGGSGLQSQSGAQATGAFTLGQTKRGTGSVVSMDAYENDLLHALSSTGGLPGLDAENEVLIYRGTGLEGAVRDRLLAELNLGRDPCVDVQELPDDDSIVRIPIRFFPDELPDFKEEDIILQTGDIVMIRSREREIFYTGGVLPGGERQLPRDYDLDVLGAIAVAGGPVGSGGANIGQSNQGGGGQGGGLGRSGIPPTRALILRKIPGNRQITIHVDLCKAISDPRERILIQPGDVVIVQYTFLEDLGNYALNLIRFNFLFNGFSGNGFQ
jgi:protein involved in polysaccharide export with SLBB domain